MKFFVVSDIHGYYDEMKMALDEAGFDPNNENSWLIVLGDCCDRGPDPIGVINYLQSLPRKIIIRGNHEQLIMEAINRQYPMRHDWHNGTAQTIIDLAPEAQTFDEACGVAYEKIKDFVGSMVNYVELKNHILVHSWIPLKNDGCFNSDWRNATQEEWNNAMWGNPFKLAKQGFNQTGKIIVFGHWHCSAGWAEKEGCKEFGDDAKFDPYYGNGHIGIDSCCAYTHKINVLKIEDGFIDGENRD